MDALIPRAKIPDRESFARLTAEHYPAIYRLCARLVGREEAADAAQETFLVAQKQLPRFEPDGKFLTWLCGIAHNVCRNRLRSQRRREAHLAPWDENAQGVGESGVIERAALRQALRELPPDLLEVVVLREVDGLTYDEIAAGLGIPLGTVKSRLHTAFGRLRQALSTEEVPR